ncbi:MAG: hypothetical protein M3Z19_12555 [Chloroflexota bacterium]|nr:hypothetical protein [Chloroflexota bacterium]
MTPSNTATLARRLVMYEAHDLDRPEALAEAGERTWERLRHRLIVLIGAEGFDALFARALALARPDYPVLADIHHEAAQGYGLMGVRESAHERAPTDLLDALVTVTAHFLAVLVRLIGADLVVRVVREIWSELPPKEIDLREETNE